MRGLKNTALLAVLLTSCVPAVFTVTPKVITPPAGTTDLRQYKAVKIVALDFVSTPYSSDGTPIFERWLRDMLQSQGYSLVEREEDMRIEVTVTEFHPGSRVLGLRVQPFRKNIWALTYRAMFKDRAGKIIAEFEGGRSYHGLSVAEDPLFMTDEQLRTGMIRHSVSQISQFIQNNGRLE